MSRFMFTISGHIEVEAENAEKARDILTVTYPNKSMASRAFIIYDKEHKVFVYAVERLTVINY